MNSAENTVASQTAVDVAQQDFISIRGVSKRYNIVQALDDVSFGIRQGEIHTLLGENGAGKSTLVKTLMGEETPDSGEIWVGGEKMAVHSPQTSQNMGISMVHQELAVFENMTVAENIFPSCDIKTKLGFVDWKELYKRAAESIQIFNMDIQPAQKMDTLTLAQQQMVEILRCICNGQRIILLDEPTSGLNNEEADRLMNTIMELKAKGITIIYISHRINEVMALSDRITVMRDGKYICTFDNTPELTEQDLVSRMVGRELSGSLYSKKTFVDASANPVLYEVQNLAKRGALESASFALREGEILGFFGLEASGAGTLSRMLYGLEGRESGSFTYLGQPLGKINPTALVEQKILYLNNNRKKAGLLLDSPAKDNMILPVMQKMSRFTLLLGRKIAEYTEKYIQTFSIVIPSIFQKPRNLSGGNQQKLMLSICLGTQPKLMIVNEPTRGIDVGAKAEIHRFLLNIAQEGIGLIVFSSELPELMALCDRVLVMKNNSIVGELRGDEITEEAVVALAAGGQ